MVKEHLLRCPVRVVQNQLVDLQPVGSAMIVV